jgi:integrase/recombinase XerD
MGSELVKAPQVIAPTIIAEQPALPAMVERASGAARFAWDEYFYAEHHDPHTQKAYMRAVKRFLAWAAGEGVQAGRGLPLHWRL